MTVWDTHPDQMAEPGMHPRQEYVRIGPEQLEPALNRLVGGSGSNPTAGREFLQYARAHQISLEYIWSMINADGSIVATVLAVPSAGRTAMIFATAATSRRSAAEIGGLIDHACRNLPASDIRLAQTLIDLDELEHQAAFVHGGFEKLARLSYMERPMPDADARFPIEWPADVTLEPFQVQHTADWLAAIEESYEQTLDCPGLLGLRTTDEILTGHQGTGEFVPELWTLLRLRNRRAGVMMLNPSPHCNTVELVYLGLAPAARGRGLATSLLRHGLTLLRGRDERTVSLAVDEQNVPAIRLYRRHGFKRVLRRVAFIRPIRAAAPAASKGARS